MHTLFLALRYLGRKGIAIVRIWFIWLPNGVPWAGAKIRSILAIFGGTGQEINMNMDRRGFTLERVMNFQVDLRYWEDEQEAIPQRRHRGRMEFRLPVPDPDA